MIKIKDNIDLKELEKFGFKKDGLLYVKDLVKDDKYLSSTWVTVSCSREVFYDFTICSSDGSEVLSKTTKEYAKLLRKLDKAGIIEDDKRTNLQNT